MVWFALIIRKWFGSIWLQVEENETFDYLFIFSIKVGEILR